MIKNHDALQRYSALILLLLGLYLLGDVLGTLVDMKTSAKQQYETLVMQRNKYQLMVDDKALYEAKHKVLDIQRTNDKRFYEAKTSSLAVADFQKDLQTIMQKSNAKLISMQVANVKSKNETDFLPMKMSLRLRVDNVALAKVLHTLESRKPQGFIDVLKIQPQSAHYQRYSEKSGAGLNQTIEVTIEYTAFYSEQL